MTLKKAEYIAKYGEVAYEKMLERNREGYRRNKERAIAGKRMRRLENSEKVKADNNEKNRKGGKYYEKHLKDSKTGLQGEKNRIRAKHRKQYHPYKVIIALGSQLHHEWIPQTAEYRGVALVEATPHQYGIIDVIQLLDGEITLLTEEEIRNHEPTIDIPHEEALALIQEIQAKKDRLGMEMIDWIDWSEEVVGMISDLFDINEKEVSK